MKKFVPELSKENIYWKLLQFLRNLNYHHLQDSNQLHSLSNTVNWGFFFLAVDDELLALLNYFLKYSIPMAQHFVGSQM